MEGAVNGFHVSPVRRATLEDVSFLVSLAREKYPQRPLAGIDQWATQILQTPSVAIFICGESVSIVTWQIEAYNLGMPIERVADVLPMYGRLSAENPWAQFKALKAAIQWAKENGCYAIRFGSSIGARSRNREGIDLFAPFAARLGARPFGVTYILELNQCPQQ